MFFLGRGCWRGEPKPRSIIANLLPHWDIYLCPALLHEMWLWLPLRPGCHAPSCSSARLEEPTGQMASSPLQPTQSFSRGLAWKDTWPCFLDTDRGPPGLPFGEEGKVVHPPGEIGAVLGLQVGGSGRLQGALQAALCPVPGSPWESVAHFPQPLSPEDQGAATWRAPEQMWFLGAHLHLILPLASCHLLEESPPPGSPLWFPRSFGVRKNIWVFWEPLTAQAWNRHQD